MQIINVTQCLEQRGYSKVIQMNYKNDGILYFAFVNIQENFSIDIEMHFRGELFVLGC